MYLDQKVTMWERSDFGKEITKKELIEMVRSGDIDYDQRIDIDGLAETIQELAPEENGGSSTIEILDGDKKVVWRNAPVQQPAKYFLFGSDACCMYQDEKEKFLRQLRNGTFVEQYEIHKFWSPENLLESFSGFGDYCVLDFEEYTELLKAEKTT